MIKCPVSTRDFLPNFLEGKRAKIEPAKLQTPIKMVPIRGEIPVPEVFIVASIVLEYHIMAFRPVS